ncbi:trigger factor [Friedmanniella endophytica]|uniref:Trigger factor n=1 Tax=Microlunatus kandeliicorticis TaxID=1759536 RepID=A0A7W3IVH7_9ACTN|nr:trigger factor [Microlunatus kandeliicorticis]MBA8796043.1 trigger factor [Microlunatus kandeliicorticis]
MPSTVEKLSPSRVKLTVEIPFSELKPSMDKAYRDIAQQVNIPGFRKGKVPPRIIDQRFGRGVILQEALNEALPDFYGQAITDNNLNPLAQPEVEVTKLEDGELIEFTAEVDVRPDFDVPSFDTLTATVDALDVPDDLVDSQLDTLRSRFGSLDEVDRPVEDGDHLTIDLVARKDGEPLEDATAEGLSYVVGSGSMLEGLDEAVTGLSVGESKEFRSTLVGGPLKDEEADVEVTVKKVQVQDLPAADDEFAQMASEFDTIDELKADLRARLTNMARLEQASQARDKVLEDLIAKVDAEVPENLLTSETAARREQIEGQLSQAGMTLEDYLKDAEDETAETPEQFWADSEKRSADALKAQMVLDKISDDRQIGVDQNDLTQHVIRRAQAEGVSPDEVARHMVDHNHTAEWMTEIRRGKALAMVVEAAKVVDSNGEPVDLVNLQPDGSLADPNAVVATNDETTDETTDESTDESTEQSSPEPTDEATVEDGDAEQATEEVESKA